MIQRLFTGSYQDCKIRISSDGGKSINFNGKYC